MLLPKLGTLERVVLDKLKQKGQDGVTFLDFAHMNITEIKLDEIIRNLRTGMFEDENDNELGLDS